MKYIRIDDRVEYKGRHDHYFQGSLGHDPSLWAANWRRYWRNAFPKTGHFLYCEVRLCDGFCSPFFRGSETEPLAILPHPSNEPLFVFAVSGLDEEPVAILGLPYLYGYMVFPKEHLKMLDSLMEELNFFGSEASIPLKANQWLLLKLRGLGTFVPYSG